MTGLFVAPVNPISLDLHPQVNSYIAPLFQQNWQLFAPTPVNEERGFLVRARVSESNGEIRTTEFYDFTSPLVNEIHARRLFPPRKPRMVSNTMQLLGFKDPIADRLRKYVEDLSVEQLAEGNTTLQVTEEHRPLPLTPSEAQVYRTGVETVRLVASKAAHDRWGDNIIEIQVRIVVNEFPPFSQRGANNVVGEVTIQDLGWLEAAT